MKKHKLDLEKYQRFWEDFDRRVSELNEAAPMSYSRNIELINEWYDITIEVDELGNSAEVTMNDQDYTWFILKWAS